MSRKNHKADKHPSVTLEYPMRLDLAIFKLGMSYSRSRAEEYIKKGYVHVNGLQQTKPGLLVHEQDVITTKVPEEYVSRAGLKLASVAKDLALKFDRKTVLDVGSSTGGFTDYALRHGARKVVAVDVGTDQMHPTLQNHPKIELHEKTDIRDFKPKEQIDMIVMDVSFISARYILPHLFKISSTSTEIIIMVKPQFEAGKQQINKGVIKNDTVRRQILKDFEAWVQEKCIIKSKADSKVAGAKGNVERFYKLVAR